MFSRRVSDATLDSRHHCFATRGPACGHPAREVPLTELPVLPIVWHAMPRAWSHYNILVFVDMSSAAKRASSWLLKAANLSMSMTLCRCRA